MIVGAYDHFSRDDSSHDDSFSFVIPPNPVILSVAKDPQGAETTKPLSDFLAITPSREKAQC